MQSGLDRSLEKNLAALEKMFGQSGDYYAKRIRIADIPAAIVMFDNLAGVQALWTILLEYVSKPGLSLRMQAACGGQAVYEYLMRATDLPAEPTPAKTEQDVVMRLTAGFALLFLDGCSSAIAFSVQNLKYRAVSTPSAEGNVRGSREGFSDLLRVNISLLRRLIRTDSLVAEIVPSETSLKTEYAICYDKHKVSPSMLAQLQRCLKQANPPVLLDSSYFVPWLNIKGLRLFTPVGYTERPAVAAAKIQEGKIIVMVNGSPSAMIVPFLFTENFTCLDDYGGPAYFAALLRGLKYISFLLTVTLPGWFVCISVYMPELLPPQLLYKISAAEQGTPLPLFAEMLVVILVLEIIREAGLRMPHTLGNSVSLVAALIVGDAAISAGILSTYVILIAAIAAIAMYVTPNLYEPAAVLRMGFLLAGGIAGPAGAVGMLLFLLLALASPELFGVCYAGMLMPVRPSLWKDGILRENLHALSAEKETAEREQNT